MEIGRAWRVHGWGGKKRKEFVTTDIKHLDQLFSYTKPTHATMTITVTIVATYGLISDHVHCALY